MCRRVAVGVVLVIAFVFMRSGVGLAVGGGNGESGGDQSATGELLGDGSAEAFARDGGDLGDPGHARRGGGHVVCRYYDEGTGEPVNFAALPEDREGILVI